MGSSLSARVVAACSVGTLRHRSVGRTSHGWADLLVRIHPPIRAISAQPCGRLNHVWMPSRADATPIKVVRIDHNKTDTDELRPNWS